MSLNPLNAVSPVDGRYHGKTNELADYFSEYALIKYRVTVEVEYFKALINKKLPQLESIPSDVFKKLDSIIEKFNEASAEEIKTIERTTNHDVKAVEYYLKEQFETLGLSEHKEFIHFGLTSQDINNTSVPMSIRDAMVDVYTPEFHKIIAQLRTYVEEWKNIPMLARTHGQPASPTILGKEFMVFVERLEVQFKQIESIPFKAKFGGATGNFNAHFVAYPQIDWTDFGNEFVSKHLGLERSQYTTQIEHYDNLGALFHALCRINTILTDMCRDIWTYISMDYFKQKVIAGEVGSSAMPHKVNPIDFENAEGNFGIANSIFEHLASKLPISRLQRDLTDSTVLRNVGVPFAHSLIGFKSVLKGLGKLLLNKQKLHEDLDKSWMVVAEAVQNILRREAFPKPYEALKELTRGKAEVTQSDIMEFVANLDVSLKIKEELLKLTPHNYVGKVNL